MDGRVVAAVEEERLNRTKGGKPAHVDNTLILPFNAIDTVLKTAGLAIRDVDLIATSFCPDRRKSFSGEWSKYGPVLAGNYETPEGDRVFMRLMELSPQVLAARFDLPAAWFGDRFRWVPHHVAHIASAFFPSGFSAAAAMTIDGIGEFETATLADCTGSTITMLEETQYPNSLGFVWEVMTIFLGFESNNDESKIMGLAAYGNPDVYRDRLRRLVAIEADGRFSTHIDASTLIDNFSAIERTIGIKRRLPYEPLAWQGRDRRHADLAAALQEATNEVFVGQAQALRRRTGRNRLVMAGGVCLNCVANGQVAEQCGFEDVFIQPATGDAGTAVGAALAVLHSQSAEHRPAPTTTPYLGPEYSDAEILSALQRFNLGCEELQDPTGYAADLIANDRIVGWFQGRMEFGPRALGNRSLLANPSSPSIRHILNLQVKHREEFRPFCPTILAEDAQDWLECDGPIVSASKLMLVTYKVRYEKRALVPAILHTDGSARVQILDRRDNPLFHELVCAFKKRTGVPLLLNTSFNDREPIVCSPEDACKCYLKTRFDAMILGRFLVCGPKPWERDPRLSHFEQQARHFDNRERRSARGAK